MKRNAEKGRLLAIMARSGHYKPSEESMLIAIDVLVKLKVRLDGVLLIYHEDEKSRSFGIGGLKGAELLARIGTDRDSKVKISSSFMQHLSRQELRSRLLSNSFYN